MSPHSGTRVAPRICPLCEATCGLLFEMDDKRVVGVSPNHDDVFSNGHSCAKGLGLGALENDPDALRVPLIRDGGPGQFREASWEEAFQLIAENLPRYAVEAPGTCAVYTGNPAAHHLDPSLYMGSVVQALQSKSLFSPASIDTLPKNVAHMLLYGTGLGMSVPDIDRTDYLLMLGSNPLVSNGSTITAPGIERRLSNLRARGGTFIVVDPARTLTAEASDTHVALRPGTDALFLLGLLSVIAEEERFDLGDVGGLVDGMSEVLRMAAPYTPETVAPACGIEPGVIVDVARGFAGADRAVATSRIGSCMQEFGTLTNWLVEVLTIVTGNLDRPGGAMFPMPPAGGQNTWPAPKVPTLTFGRWHSRVRGLPEAMGELPAVCFPEEILTPGPGRIRALLTIAGNPARSLPNSHAVEAALDSLEFMVCIDGYVNETTRYADVILPPPPLTTRGHFDLALTHFQVRNVARYTAPIVPPAEGQWPEWKILLRIAAIAAGTPERHLTELDDEIAHTAIRRAARLAGRTHEEAESAVAGRTGPERLLDLRLRSGPYGDRFGADPDGITLRRLEENPNGIDFGPMSPRMPEVLRTPNSRINLVPEMIVADLPRLRASLDRGHDELLLINRRQRRGMNSWLHNALPPVDDADSALFMNPADAEANEIFDGDMVGVTSTTASVEIEVIVTTAVRPGVVSLPHGWGHAADGIRIHQAASAPGANVNALVDNVEVEPVCFSPIFNGVPVTVSALATTSTGGIR